MLAFSAVSIVVLVAILMGQALLPFSRGMAGMALPMAINTAVSFVTNTNWQSYAGESTLGYTAQAVGLTVQNFVSAAVGIAVAAALLRGFAARSASDDRQLLGRPDPDRAATAAAPVASSSRCC